MAKNTAVFGIYRNRSQAESAVDQLIEAGFRTEDISVLLAENVGTKDFAHEKHTKAPEGTATGAAAGGVVGGTLGLLAGIGALAIPGLGPFIAAGPIMALLAAREQAGLSAAWSALWSAWGSPNTKRSAMRVVSKRAASSCPFTAMTLTGPRRPRYCYNKPALRTFHPRAKQGPTSLRPTNRCRRPGLPADINKPALA